MGNGFTTFEYNSPTLPGIQTRPPRYHSSSTRFISYFSHKLSKMSYVIAGRAIKVRRRRSEVGLATDIRKLNHCILDLSSYRTSTCMSSPRG